MFSDQSKSIKIGNWFGIPVYLHWSFFLVFLYAIYIGNREGMNNESIVWLMGYFVATFACVLLHEYGHALTARRYGVPTHDIILMPLGGMARLARIPEKPWHEFLVAIAGPLVNIVIAAVLFGATYAVTNVDDSFAIEYALKNPSQEMDTIFKLWALMIYTNLALFVFNLVPAFPMDGGRIFRALMAMAVGKLKATKYAMWLGIFFAVGFIGFGLYGGNFIMALIGGFVIKAARDEYAQVRIRALASNFTARDIVRYKYTTLYNNDWIQSASDLLAHSLERSFVVLNRQDQIVGVIGEEMIRKAHKEGKLSQEIGSFLKTGGAPMAPIHTSVILLQDYLNSDEVDLLVIYDDTTQEIVGVIDEAGLDYFLDQREQSIG
jgi:Zn-dependent protease